MHRGPLPGSLTLGRCTHHPRSFTDEDTFCQAVGSRCFMDRLPKQWAEQFGLALAPLFEGHEVDDKDSHAVLLDGGYGSFAMSETKEELWHGEDTAAWAWSSNLPHHVMVTDDNVAVRRWDKPVVEVFSRSSVNTYIEPFYEYLVTDRVRSNRRVVDYVLDLFRRVRSLVEEAGISDEKSIDAFLEFLTAIMEGGQQRVIAGEILGELSKTSVNRLIEEVHSKPNSPQSFRLFPALAIRHAGSEIFQEAHFELIRVPKNFDLFGDTEPAKTIPVTRGGAHFTPPALARSVAEQTLRQIGDLASREQISILDPACGSGSFLHEALRVLRRSSFAGKIVLIGRDTSLAAVSMARFVLRHAAADWSQRSNIEIDVQVADSLVESLPSADVVLMNPPFIAWLSLNDEQRSRMLQILGNRMRGRGDFSMAFVSRAADVLSDRGAMGVLLPSSLLTLQAAEAWRADLLERMDLRLLGSLGDYGIFPHALVQVAVAIMVKNPTSPTTSIITALVTANRSEATGDALRMLRRAPNPEFDAGAAGWRLFPLPIAKLQSRPTWRLTTPKIERALSRLIDAGAVRVSDIFQVRQGIRTGNTRAFVLSKHDFEALPKKEREFFRPAVMNRSIQDGQLQSLYWIFYPYNRAGPRFNTKDELLSAVPVYVDAFLKPWRKDLVARNSLPATRNWWDLSRERLEWALDRTPRMVSKYFGGPGGFAVDSDADFLVVQGHAWFLWDAPLSDDEGDSPEFDVDELLYAYTALMNSDVFGRLLEIFSPHVAGGQFNLSRRYVGQIPIPNFVDLTKDEQASRLISKLVDFGKEPHFSERSWKDLVDRIATELYGGDLFHEI